MRLHFRSLGAVLQEAVQDGLSPDSTIVIAAPFIKYGPFQSLLDSIPSSHQIDVYTRWHVHEVALGVSDPAIWNSLKSRKEASLWLQQNLHAKYLRFGSKLFVGSANITGKALGMQRPVNLETLIELSTDEVDYQAFEDFIKVASLEVSDELFHLINELSSKVGEQLSPIHEYAFIPPGADEELSFVAETSSAFDAESVSPPKDQWTPTLRRPSDLYAVYSGDLESLTSPSVRNARADLEAFQLSSGLSRDLFRAEIRWQLFQMPIVQQIDNYVEEPTRFGAVSDYLKTLPCANSPGFDPKHTWQTMIRWLLHFFPDRYRYSEANYSEIFGRKEQGDP